MNLYDDRIGIKDFDTVYIEHDNGFSIRICAGFLLYGNILESKDLYFQNVIILTPSNKLKEFTDLSSKGNQIKVKILRLVLTEKTKDWNQVI